MFLTRFCLRVACPQMVAANIFGPAILSRRTASAATSQVSSNFSRKRSSPRRRPRIQVSIFLGLRAFCGPVLVLHRCRMPASSPYNVKLDVRRAPHTTSFTFLAAPEP